MIPVIDNLERAVEHANGSDEDDHVLLEGVQMTLEQFRKVLESFGVKAVESVGSAFDPNFHQAMGQMVSADYPPNTVIEELQKGYMLHNRLLRPAMVMVAKAPEQEMNETNNEEDSAPEDGAGDTE